MMADSEDAEQDIRRALDVDQSMIDIWADRLEGLRTQCSTSAELTQQEIRTLEVREKNTSSSSFLFFHEPLQSHYFALHYYHLNYFYFTLILSL